MALTPEDLAQIAEMMAAQQASQPNVVVANDDANRMQKEADAIPPAFWIHLADGRVLESHDSASTHIDGIAVIGRYPIQTGE